MRKVVVTIASALLLALAGCSSSSNPSTTSTPGTTSAAGSTSTGSTTSAKPASVHLELRSGGVIHGNLAARYTCDGQNISPPVEWGHVPPGTKSLALFVFGLTPEAHSKTSEVTFEWTLAGINPSLGRLAAGQLPAGAYVGRGSFKRSRYDVCPKRGEAKQYEFALFPVPSTLTVPKVYEDIQLLHLLLTTPSGESASNDTSASFLAAYKRK